MYMAEPGILQSFRPEIYGILKRKDGKTCRFTYFLCGTVACLKCLAGLVLDHWWPFSDTLLLWPLAAKKSIVRATVSTFSEATVTRVANKRVFAWFVNDVIFPREMWIFFRECDFVSSCERWLYKIILCKTLKYIFKFYKTWATSTPPLAEEFVRIG